MTQEQAIAMANHLLEEAGVQYLLLTKNEPPRYTGDDLAAIMSASYCTDAKLMGLNIFAIALAHSNDSSKVKQVYEQLLKTLIEYGN